MSASKNKVARRPQPTEIISHWPKLIEGFAFSPQEFYSRVEKALADRQVPDLLVSRVDWKEGGFLSARREYLRLTRKRLVFDVCAAPFGTGFFVSLWFGEKPQKLGFLFLLLLLAIIGVAVTIAVDPPYAVYSSLRRSTGLASGGIALLLSCLAGVVVLATIVLIGPKLDGLLIRTPVVGYFYEKYFRRITYYRVDQMCMYQQAVHSAVMQVIEEITKAQGITALSDIERRPVFCQLFHPQGSNGHN